MGPRRRLQAVCNPRWPTVLAVVQRSQGRRGADRADCTRGWTWAFKEDAVTVDDFRSMALTLPEATESAHMGHPDFRVRGKIFATIWPDDGWGMVKLTPEQQTTLVQAEPTVFMPVKGGWGRRAQRTCGWNPPTRRRFRAPSSPLGATSHRRPWPRNSIFPETDGKFLRHEPRSTPCSSNHFLNPFSRAAIASASVSGLSSSKTSPP